MSPKIERLISLIFTTGRLVRERSRDKSELDLFSILRLETLHYVERGGTPSMREMAEHLCVTPPSATSLINELVKSRQLARIRDKRDRRIVRLALTPKGKRVMKTGFKRLTARMRKIFANLDDKEINSLIKILEKLSQTYRF